MLSLQEDSASLARKKLKKDKGTPQEKEKEDQFRNKRNIDDEDENDEDKKKAERRFVLVPVDPRPEFYSACWYTVTFFSGRKVYQKVSCVELDGFIYS